MDKFNFLNMIIFLYVYSENVESTSLIEADELDGKVYDKFYIFNYIYL